MERSGMRGPRIARFALHPGYKRTHVQNVRFLDRVASAQQLFSADTLSLPRNDSGVGMPEAQGDLMKKILAAALAASTLTGFGAAQAADMPLKAPPLEIPFSWTGWYVGGNVGWLHGNADYDPVCPTLNPNCPVLFPFFAFNDFIPGIGNILTFVPSAFGSLPGGSASNNSFMGGGQIGYNYQSGRLVFGAEADLDATHIRASLTRNGVSLATGFPPGFFGTVTANSTFDSDWIASLRGRLGVTFGRAMLYGTGGIAFAGSSATTSFLYTPPGNALPAFIQPGPTGGSASQVLTGWTVGVGGEWLVTDRVGLGAEYRHSDFGRQNYTLGFDTINAPIINNIHYTTDQVTVRANWHFWAH
jgi:outer membrane immunogenic protein